MLKLAGNRKMHLGEDCYNIEKPTFLQVFLYLKVINENNYFLPRIINL
jgi:hypothetical protein